MSWLPGPVVAASRLQERIAAGDPDLLVVDTRCNLEDPAWGRARYLEGHLPGAVFADLDTELSGPRTGRNGRHPLPSRGRMTAVFGALGIGPRTTVVAYDDLSGMFAARLWWMLRYLGHRDAALLDGGLQSWRRAGGALESGEAPRTPATFAARPQERMRVDLEAVETSLEKGELLLLDAREAFRWRGEREPIDPVAGRIPGARNHPWQRNLAEDGRFLDPGRLRERFAPAAAASRGRRIACYCGSGVTAAHNALALNLAGIGPAAVYVGSWSEWSADPARPIERG